KERADQSKLAELISRGTPVSQPRTGVDGGMHPVFVNKLPDPQTVAMTDATDFAVSAYGPAPGTIPAHVNPPTRPEGSQVADTSPVTQESNPNNMTANGNVGAVRGGFFSSLAAKVGLRGNEKQDAASTTTSAQAAKPALPSNAPKSKPIPKTSDVAKATEPAGNSAARVISLDKPKPAVATAQAKPPFPDAPAAQPAPAQSMAGAQPTVPANNFDSRWSSFR
ncbi:MAG TPA: hypothetical protein VGC86_03225, partial [Afipia sp.]